MIQFFRTTISQQAPIVYEAEYQAVLDYAVANSITTPDSTTNDRNNLRVKYLKDVGLWNGLDLLYIFDHPTGLADFSKINWKAPSSFYLFNANPALEPDFIADSGFKSDSTKWFNTGYNLSTSKTNVTNSSACVFYKGFDFANDATVESIYGGRIGNNTSQLVGQKNSATAALHRNQNTIGTYAFNGVDHNMTIIHSSTNVGDRIYRDGTATNTRAAMSGAGYSNVNMFLFCFSENGTPTQINKSGLKFFGFSASIGIDASNANAVNLYEILTDIYTP